MKKPVAVLTFTLALALFPVLSHAHFGMLIPSDAMVMPDDAKALTLTLSFSHPFEQAGMEMASPKAFGVVANGEHRDLLSTLKETRVMGHGAWTADFAVNRPGVHQFYMEPTPYWEPAEDCFIIHYTKTVVAAFGDDEGWDGEVGLKTEIVPLSRPFGLYRGNVFQGVVKVDGKPVPFADVEVEFKNDGGRVKAPTDYMITQTVKADANGVFTYAPPAAGWWGFAALTEADFKLPHEGADKAVELGAVLWVEFQDWQGK